MTTMGEGETVTHSIPKGFRLSGVHCGIKNRPEKRDLVLIVGDADLCAAGVFTTSRVCAAPVQTSRRRVPSDRIRGVIVNSGNANACTGPGGLEDAAAMGRLLSAKLGVADERVLVCSTGVIGRRLPMAKIAAGVEAAWPMLGNDPAAATAAAEGILTTDTCTKTSERVIELPGGPARLLGFAKGAAMIGPNMATMLAFLVTDAVADPELLDRSLRAAVDESFHCISVEGHQSTNDTVLLLASGASGSSAATDEAKFAAAVADVCKDLARAIATDAEGATHLVTIDVVGCRSNADARKIARTVADSALFKTAVFGNDPNWGRIVSAAGYAGVEFVPENLSVFLNGVKVYDRGGPAEFDKPALAAKMKSQRDTLVLLRFDLGGGQCRFWTCDLGYEYVRINAEYTT